MKSLAVLAASGLLLLLIKEPLGYLPGSGLLTLLWLLAVILYSYQLMLRLPDFMAAVLTKRVLQKMLMLVISLWVTMFALQIGLSVYDRFVVRSAGEKSTMPAEWDKIPLNRPPGCNEAYRWHGHDHYFYAEGFRRTVPLDPKPEDTWRIVFFGDSLTYAQGIADENSYVSILSRELTEYAAALGKKLDVINLGVCGANSPDILEFGYRYLALLRPDLVVYGMCLNDFNTKGSEYRYNYRWKLPIPESFNQWMWHRTRAWRWLSVKYNEFLMRMGLRDDFYGDILRDWDGYQMRFGSDVRKMNDFVLTRGLPPVVFMVVSQSPTVGGRGWQIAMRAEELAGQGGMNVVSCSDYFTKYDGMNLKVSEWEGHPNEEAHRIFADELKPVLIEQIKRLNQQ